MLSALIHLSVSSLTSSSVLKHLQFPDCTPYPLKFTFLAQKITCISSKDTLSDMGYSEHYSCFVYFFFLLFVYFDVFICVLTLQEVIYLILQ